MFLLNTKEFRNFWGEFKCGIWSQESDYLSYTECSSQRCVIHIYSTLGDSRASTRLEIRTFWLAVSFGARPAPYMPFQTPHEIIKGRAEQTNPQFLHQHKTRLLQNSVGTGIEGGSWNVYGQRMFKNHSSTTIVLLNACPYSPHFDLMALQLHTFPLSGLSKFFIILSGPVPIGADKKSSSVHR